MLDDPLADDGLRDPANCLIAGMRRDFHFQFQADVAVRMHARRKVYIHANIQIRELRIHQWVYKACAAGWPDAYTRLKAACCDRDAVADAQFGGLAVHRANFRVLDNPSVRITQDGVRRQARQGNGVSVSSQVAQLV